MAVNSACKKLIDIAPIFFYNQFNYSNGRLYDFDAKQIRHQGAEPYGTDT